MRPEADQETEDYGPSRQHELHNVDAVRSKDLLIPRIQLPDLFCLTCLSEFPLHSVKGGHKVFDNPARAEG